MSQARKFFVKRKIDLEDFGKLKREYRVTSRKLNTELFKINSLLKQPGDIEKSELNFSSIIFQSYNKNEIADKRKMINLIAPVNIDQENLMIQPLKLNNALSKIIFKCA